MKIKSIVEVTKIMLGVGTNDGFITIRFPYGYAGIKGKFKRGDMVKIIIKKINKQK